MKAPRLVRGTDLPAGIGHGPSVAEAKLMGNRKVAWQQVGLLLDYVSVPNSELGDSFLGGVVGIVCPGSDSRRAQRAGSTVMDEDRAGNPMQAGVPDPAELTRIFNEAEDARAGLGEAFEEVYGELRRLAGSLLGARGPLTLNATAVVHEAYAKLVEGRQLNLQGRQHFFALCARVMRQVITDHARRKLAAKRGGGRIEVTIDDALLVDAGRPESIAALDDALEWLSTRDDRLVQLLHYRVFAGLDLSDIAPLMGVTVRQLQRDWQRAKAWLSEALLAVSS